jgi:hypothetical protein
MMMTISRTSSLAHVVELRMITLYVLKITMELCTMMVMAAYRSTM